jgi:hypothetical protein
LSGELAGGGDEPPQAASAPSEAMAASNPTIAMFFMMVFSSKDGPIEGGGPYASAARAPSISRHFRMCTIFPRATPLFRIHIVSAF